MTVMAIFCMVALAVQIPSDLFVAGARDTEVWGGLEVHGLAAMLTAPIHWALFATGAWAFWTARPWAPTAAACYAFYVGLCHVVWSVTSPHGRGLPIGTLQMIVFTIVGISMLRAGAKLAAEART
jgi:hypothetical protein